MEVHQVPAMLVLLLLVITTVEGNTFMRCQCKPYYSRGCLCVARSSCDSSNVIVTPVPDLDFDSMNILKYCRGIEKCCKRPSDNPTTTTTTTTTPAPTTTTTTTTTTPAPTTTPTTTTTTNPPPSLPPPPPPTTTTTTTTTTTPPPTTTTTTTPAPTTRTDAVYKWCGLRETTNYVPWLAAVFKKSRDGERSFLCGASIIHPSVVLTAAGCLTNLAADESLVVVADITQLSEHLSTSVTQVRDVKTSVVNEHYRPTRTDFDFALLELVAPLEVTPTVEMMCLRQPDSRPILSQCLGAGYSSGLQGVAGGPMRMVNLVVQPNSVCENKLWGIYGENYILPAGVSCAEGPSLCQEDYGGPVMCPLEQDPYRFVQVGIILKPLRCGDSSVPVLLTNTTYLGPAIERALMSIVKENYAVYPAYNN